MSHLWCHVSLAAHGIAKKQEAKEYIILRRIGLHAFPFYRETEPLVVSFSQDAVAIPADRSAGAMWLDPQSSSLHTLFRP